MSAQLELEKLKAMRAELEAETHSLQEYQTNLENRVLALEEKVVNEELKKEKAVIEELKKRNKAAKDDIAQLEAKKKELENKLAQESQTPENPPLENKKRREVPEPTEAATEEAEEAEEGGVTVTAIEGEAIVESPEAKVESPKKGRKKHRFF